MFVASSSLILRIELETGSGLKTRPRLMTIKTAGKSYRSLFDSKSNLAEYLKEAGHVQVNKDVT